MIVNILTISDRSSQGLRDDKSGPLLCKFINELTWDLGKYSIIPDEINIIKNTLVDWSDNMKTDLILTTGGTGFAPRDNTPEATLSIITKNAPGISEFIRFKSMQITPHAMLSRGVAGIRNKTLIINLPGSPKAAIESLEFVLPALPHAIELINDDKNAEANH